MCTYTVVRTPDLFKSLASPTNLESPRIVVITPGTRLMSVESRDRHILDRGNGLKWLVSKTVPVFV
jgi:hypothetical protein